MYNDKLIQNTIVVILKLSTFVTINSTNYQLLISSKFKSTQLKSIQSKFKSKVIKFIDVKKIYIFENNNDNDNNNNDKLTFYNNDDNKSIFRQHFITFIKTFFIVNELIITNIFVVLFIFDASIFDNDDDESIFQQYFITFVITN